MSSVFRQVPSVVYSYIELFLNARWSFRSVVPVGVDEDVVTLDVTMNDLLVVQVLEALEDLARVVGDGALVLLEWAPLGAQQFR